VSFARPSSDTIKGANLYVSGLSKDIISADLTNMLQPFGTIITSRVLCDPHTGRNNNRSVETTDLFLLFAKTNVCVLCTVLKHIYLLHIF